MRRFERLFEDANEGTNRVVKARTNYSLDSGVLENFRLSREQIEHVLLKVGANLHHGRDRNYALSPLQQLLTTLHWLGNGGQYHGVANMHGINKSTVCRVIHRVADTIIEKMMAETVCWPENVQDIPTKFFEMEGFPQVAGCIDGTIINKDAPTANEEHFVNRHGKQSLNVMMVCGPDRSFNAVNSNWPGSVHDSRVLRNTKLFSNFESGFRPFPGAVILGDSAYPLNDWLIPPMRRNPDDAIEQRFNRAHKRTRRIVENSFGILKEKFPCLNHLRAEPTVAGKIVLVCCILHNIAIKMRSNDFMDVELDDDYDDNDFSISEAINGDEEITNDVLQNILNFFN